jgi:hypothetical protein
VHDKANPCEYVQEWQSQLHPSCNAVHEIDFLGGVRSRTASAQSQSQPPKEEEEGSATATTTLKSTLEYLCHGRTRDAWTYTYTYQDHQHQHQSRLVPPPKSGATNSHSLTHRVVVKTIQYSKEYTEMSMDRQRIDAIATEMLAKSPYVIHIYGFCGDVTLNEYAPLEDLEQFMFNKTNNKNKSKNATRRQLTSRQRLLFARDAAMAISHVHSVTVTDVDDPQDDNRNKKKQPASMVHHDIKPPNFLVVRADNSHTHTQTSNITRTNNNNSSSNNNNILMLKLHYFNNAHLLKVDNKKHHFRHRHNHDGDFRCGFRYNEP